MRRFFLVPTRTALFFLVFHLPPNALGHNVTTIAAEDEATCLALHGALLRSPRPGDNTTASTAFLVWRGGEKPGLEASPRSPTYQSEACSCLDCINKARERPGLTWHRSLNSDLKALPKWGKSHFPVSAEA